MLTTKKTATFLENLDLDKLIQFGIRYEDINNEVMRFIETYGIANILEFDKDSGGYFSKNNYHHTRNFFEKYMHYAPSSSSKEDKSGELGDKLIETLKKIQPLSPNPDIELEFIIAELEKKKTEKKKIKNDN